MNLHSTHASMGRNHELQVTCLWWELLKLLRDDQLKDFRITTVSAIGYLPPRKTIVSPALAFAIAAESDVAPAGEA